MSETLAPMLHICRSSIRWFGRSAVLCLAIFVCSAHAQETEVNEFRASDGARLSYLRSGNGPTCIFIHGGPGQGFESFRQMGGQRLEAFIDLIYLDQRGSGHSPPSDNYHLDRMVEDIEQLRASLALDHICLIAHSFGGIIANAYARKHGERLSGMIMINTTLEFYGAPMLQAQIDQMEVLLGRSGATKRKNETTDGSLLAKRDVLRADLFKTDRPFALFTSRAETVQTMTAIDSGYDRIQEFGRAVMAKPTRYPEYFESQILSTASITQPVLVLAGRDDYMIGPHSHEAFLYPEMQVEVLPCGHLPYFDCSDDFVHAVRSFFRMTAPSAPGA